MNIFDLRNSVLDDYRGYVKSFLNIRDKRISDFVDEKIAEGALWPDPLVQLNPSYQMGRSVEDLVDEGILHSACGQIFQREGKSFRLYRHQERSIELAVAGKSYVLTTGTGSGKSLTYLIPIMNHILSNDPEPHQVRALIVYPMNALINSQEQAISRLLDNLPENDRPIRFARYTGQENQEIREKLRKNPPHILLTNYMMLELMMSRTTERVFLDQTLRSIDFIVLDELHTYTGRQGADVAMLIRRVRSRCASEKLICIGTSATMVSGGTVEDQRKAVAQVAGKMFGLDLPPENVIDETLVRSTSFNGPLTPEVLRRAIEQPPPENYADMMANPLAAWIEETFGIRRDGEDFRRRIPITIADGAKQLSELTGVDSETCKKTLFSYIHAGSLQRGLDNSPVIALRLHQFISKGDAVYATIEPSEKRTFSLNGQRYIVDKKTGRELLLAPLAFCRFCGQEYYKVIFKEHPNIIEPRPASNFYSSEEDAESAGFLVIDENDVWSDDRINDMPENWFEEKKKGRFLKSEFKSHIPKKIYVDRKGAYSSKPEEGSVGCWFFEAPFLFCLECNASYDRKTNEFRKLSTLSSEGRSTATTILCSSLVTSMKDTGALPKESRKVLSFTDNRQDASLQAGHFNDFVQIGLIRSSIYKALTKQGRLEHHKIATAVAEAMSIPASMYAKNPGGLAEQPQVNQEAIKAYLEYHVYKDLRRGWRIVQPNLEECGLLKIDYRGLGNFCQQKDWDAAFILSSQTPERRYDVCKAFIDHLRYSLAINAACFQYQNHDSLRKKVNNTLKDPWRFDDAEKLVESKWFRYGKTKKNEMSLAKNSALGRFLCNRKVWENCEPVTSLSDYEKLLSDLTNFLSEGGFLIKETDGKEFRIQLQNDKIFWIEGDGGTIEVDRVRSLKNMALQKGVHGRTPNKFFVEFYKNGAKKLSELEAREHTGQTSKANREDREQKFRAGDLPVLFCSPTMELGIDIADLNSVNLRNVPRTPANYAQRSGRAGRSGQPALIVTYCATGSGHDQYFFRRPTQMVSGVVSPPQLDLGNEDLLKSHIHSVWLAETGLDLGSSIADLLDMDADKFPLLDSVVEQIKLTEKKNTEIVSIVKTILEQCSDDLRRARWFNDNWIGTVIATSPSDFDRSFDRWRELYVAADELVDNASKRIKNAHRLKLSKDDKFQAKRDQDRGMRQTDLLCNTTDDRDQSDFYPYRYLASEGFLPGYNFPRLPVRAFIPAAYGGGEYLSRPRFTALNEYGPQNVVYHEGRKFRVYKSVIPASKQEMLAKAKLCKTCGTYLDEDNFDLDLCDFCNTQLDSGNSDILTRLFEMTAVETHPEDRISCDEEERLKLGYITTTHFRFSREDGRENRQAATNFSKEKSQLLEIVYGSAANLWRVNHGWWRSSDKGFSISLPDGNWARKKGDTADNSPDAHGKQIYSNVQVFVTDTRNILLVRPRRETEIEDDEFVTLQHSLHKGICAVFQVDEGEIASERLGEGDGRRILFWEAAEGGAGVLIRLVAEPHALRAVARRALEIMHFTQDDMQTDLDCHRACYDCLMTYSNQRDHALLNRRSVKDFMELLTESTTVVSGDYGTYDECYQRLRSQTDPKSDLERDFLDYLYQNKLKLPSEAQKLLPDYFSKPDFYYDDGSVCVFCDGSVHDDPKQAEDDKKIRQKLLNAGFWVVTIRYDKPIAEQVDEHQHVFRGA